MQLLKQLHEATESLSSLKGVPKLSSIAIDVEILKNISNQSIEQQSTLSNTPSDIESSKYTKERPFAATIKSYKTLFGEKGDKDAVYEMKLDITRMNWNYQAGDCFGIICKNREEDVISLLSLLRLAEEDVIIFKSNKPAHFGKSKYAAYDLFSYEVDLNVLPKKQFFRVLAEEAADDVDRRNLLFLSSLSGKALYTSMRDNHYNIVEILSIFPSCKPSLNILLEHLLPLQPRYYSICHSKYTNTINKISFLFNVFQFNTVSDTDKKKRGLCTGSLENEILAGKQGLISIFPRISPAAFYLKDDVNEVILIANGTGIAPFIGFLEELQKNQKNAILLYGHRTLSDKLYKNELQEFINDGTVKLIESLSRVENAPYRYIQDAIMTELSWTDLSSKHIYLCGSSAMGKGVLDTLIKYRMKIYSSTYEEASKYWGLRVEEKSFLREIWG